jgi:hypothetical protein
MPAERLRRRLHAAVEQAAASPSNGPRVLGAGASALITRVENVVWFPTVLDFVAATIAYVISPGLATDKLHLVRTASDFIESCDSTCRRGTQRRRRRLR